MAPLGANSVRRSALFEGWRFRLNTPDAQHEPHAPRGKRAGLRTILAIGPHPDDVEIGVGGTLLTLAAAGHTVHLLDMTNGEPTPQGNPAIRAKEMAAGAEVLGVAGRTTLDLPNRYVMDHIEARTKVAEVIRTVRPDLLLVPYWIDAHPDHVATSQICDAARFQAKLTKTDMAGQPWYPSKILYYLCSHLRIAFPASVIVDVSEHFETKVRALKCYPSQFERDGEWPVVELMTRYAKYFGALIGSDYGEPLISREPLGVTDIRDLI
jgi:N-acetylglucosamine malate deacetylase 1